MKLLKTVMVSMGLVLAAGSAQAVTIDSAATGLANAGTTIDFSEGGLANGTLVTNQFSGLGISFSPAMTLLTRVSPRPNFTGPALVNFAGNPFTVFNPFSINFANKVSAATFALSGNNGTATLTALLGGTSIASFTTGKNLSANNFYGFGGLVFDQITVSASAPATIALDNLAFNVAAVPVPAALPLMLLGLCGLGVFARRRVA